jgi:hypothetical protein
VLIFVAPALRFAVTEVRSVLLSEVDPPSTSIGASVVAPLSADTFCATAEVAQAAINATAVVVNKKYRFEALILLVSLNNMPFIN